MPNSSPQMSEKTTELVERTPGQLLHAVHAKHFRPNGWVDSYPSWDDYDAAGQAAWELMASDFAALSAQQGRGEDEVSSPAVAAAPDGATEAQHSAGGRG